MAQLEDLREHLIEFQGMHTVAPEMQALFRLIERLAKSDVSVLVRGETGTGKELVARAIHRLSARKSAPFEAVNCATFTGELLASELFGHVRGAFTGAVADRAGLFQRAHHGTVFLDEIAEMPLAVQAQLLRVLQERRFVPVGGSSTLEADVRLISATHKALRHEVAEHRFREDLMYRVRVVPIFLPPLRKRQGDVLALASLFIESHNQKGGRVIEQITAPARQAMELYPWPGNIRELHNVIEYAFALGEGPELTLDELTPELRGEEPEPPLMRSPLSLEARERKQILEALEQAAGHKGRAAEILGMSRSTLWRKLRELGVS